MPAPPGCNMPTEISEPKEILIYKALRKIHCDRKKESHECYGSLIIDAKGITLCCPVCGDARKTYPRGA